MPLEHHLDGQSVHVCVEGRRTKMLGFYFLLLSKIPYGM